MSTAATAPQPEISDDQTEMGFVEEVKKEWDQTKREIAPIDGPIALIKKYYAARRKHGELIGRSLAAHILEVSAQNIHAYLARGRMSDVQIGPMKLVPVNEVLSIWKERHDNGQLVYDRNSKLGGKEGPYTRKQVMEIVAGLEDGWTSHLPSDK